MNNSVFGTEYAGKYDLLYGDKDYQAECGLLEQVFQNFGNGNISSVLDFGCGTGNHSIPLAQRGYRVTGVDLSGEMLRVARQKSTEQDVEVNWVEGDVRNVQVEGIFDAGLFMFAVLGYLLPNEDVMATLRNTRKHLRPGGILAFDVWYGPAVLTIKPSDRFKIIETPEAKVLRMVSSKLDSRHHLCQVHYNIWELIGDRVRNESEELHTVRYFFPMELELMLSQTGFKLNSLTAFPTLDLPADETTWNVFGVAHAI